MSNNCIILAAAMLSANPYAGMSYGTFTDGGYYAGMMKDGANLYALIISPRESGFNNTSPYYGPGGTDNGTTVSVICGKGGTEAYATSGQHAMLAWAAALVINGFDDWYIPARDELELMLRNLKPTTDSTYIGSREASWDTTVNVNGANANSYPALPNGYTASNAPQQTKNPLFITGGAQALDTGVQDLLCATEYRTNQSTGTLYVWQQSVTRIQQTSVGKNTCGARAVRRVLIGPA